MLTGRSNAIPASHPHTVEQNAVAATGPRRRINLDG
jgi:hypothetical protein